MKTFYIIGGSDDAAVKARACAVAEAWCGAEWENSNALEIIRGDDEGKKLVEILGGFFSAVATPAFFGSAKVVWLKNFAYFKELAESKPGRELAALQARFVALVKAGAPAGVSILVDGADCDLKKEPLKSARLNAAIELEILNAMNRRERDFDRQQALKLRELAQQAGKRIAPDAAEYLGAAAGGDFNRRNNEFEKVLLYVGDRPEITLDDCRRVVTPSVEAVSWELTEALTARNPAAALALITPLTRQLNQEKRSGNVELALIYSVSNAFTDILRAHAAMAELQLPARFGPNYFSGLDPEIRERFPENFLLKLHPYRAYKICEGAARFRAREIAEAFDRIAEAQRRMVSGGEPRLVLEALILSL